MSYFVYMLISCHKGKIYTYVVYTNNLKNRLKLHNQSKGAKFTKGKTWKLIYKIKCLNKSDAMRKEYLLKKNFKLRKKIKNKNLSVVL